MTWIMFHSPLSLPPSMISPPPPPFLIQSLIVCMCVSLNFIIMFVRQIHLNRTC